MGKFKELIHLYSWEEKVSEKIVGKVYIYSLNRGEMLEREADLVEVVKKLTKMRHWLRNTIQDEKIFHKCRIKYPE